jgi:ribosomal protein S18 acetylase RimI-like enzyme
VDLEPLLRFWRAQDDLFDLVRPTWWGAVVSDPRYPRIQEPNYARVETTAPVGLGEVEGSLRPAMRRAGVRRLHVVVFHPDEQTDLLVEASTRGERIVWDLVMEHPGLDGVDRDDGVAELREVEDGFWAAHRASLRWFDVTQADVLDQLQAIEREVLVPAGRRWFTVHGEEGIDALGALLVLDGVGYVDHVVTLPRARRRGLASAIARRAVAEASAAGADRTYLLAEPEGPAVGIYDRIGFVRVTQIASWISEPAPAGA